MPEDKDRAPGAVDEADLFDDDLDLDLEDLGELPDVTDAGPGEPEWIDDAAADALVTEELPATELTNGHAPLELLEEAGPEEVADLDSELDLGEALESPLPAVSAAPSSDLEARLARLEEAARGLAVAEVTRERRRVRRKVTAASTGAGAIGAIPLLLQLAGAFNLDPEIVATCSTVAAAIGAFVAGWATPERKPTISAATLTTLSRRR